MKNEKILTGGGGEALLGAALAPWAMATDALGLFLLPKGRPGHRFMDADDEATREASFSLFLLPRGGRAPFLHQGTSVEIDNTGIRHWKVVLGEKKP
jgi:hypothetical protein